MIGNYGRFGFWSPMSTISSGASALSAWAFGEEEVAAPLSASSGSQSTQPLPTTPTGTTGSQSTSVKPKPQPQATAPSNVPPGAGPAAPSGGVPVWVWVVSAGIVAGAYAVSKR